MASANNLSTDITVLIQEYYERKALQERTFKSGLLKYAQKNKNIPKANSKVAHFHKWDKFALADDVAENAEPAAGISANAAEIKVALTEFASFISIPNFGDAVRIDSLIKESYPKFVEQAERTANYRLTTAINAGSTSGSNSFDPFTTLYANGKQSFAALGQGDQLTNQDIQRAVALLEQNGAPKIGGGYVCLLNPWSKADLFIGDTDFRSFFKLNFDVMKKGELAGWAGAMIGQQDEPFRETLGGTEGTYAKNGNVVTTYVFGADAFGATQLMGKTGWKPRFKVQDITTTGSVTTIGYRLPFAGVVLDKTFGVQIKSVTLDPSVGTHDA